MNLEWVRFIKPCLCLPQRGSITGFKTGRTSIRVLGATGKPRSTVAVATDNYLMTVQNELGRKPQGDMAANGPNGLVLPAEGDHVQRAAEALKNSQVIAVPTDTLYGFACNPCSEIAVQKIYQIKGRSATRPLAICVADVEDIQRYGTVKHLPSGLLEALFPGPVTLIVPRDDSSLLDSALNPGLRSIGVRIPDESFIRSLCRASGGALALTSANLSSQPSTVRVEEFRHLWGHCAFIFDAGQLPAGRAGSTIVDLTLPGRYTIVRDGSALIETRDVLNTFDLVEMTDENL